MTAAPARLVVGVDEAGRGPLAGPVTAAAVRLGCARIGGLDDSKRLSAGRRTELAAEIVEECMTYGIAHATVEEIDRANILEAAMAAMQRAVAGIVVVPDEVLVDGNCLPGLPYPARAIVGGDAKIPEIQAASILAKVTRDRVMEQLDREHPQYGFARNKGYPTPEHLEALRKHGPCPQHRRSFAPVRECMQEVRSGEAAR